MGKASKVLFNKTWVWFLVVVAVTACQTTPPTKVFENSKSPHRSAVKNAELAKKNYFSVDEKIEISPNTVVIDVRSTFNYSMAHVPGSYNMKWSDFTQKKEPYLGVFEKDLYRHTRRLARLGISPDTPIVVIGEGVAGEGEEGRMAWTLKLLGIKKVGFASHNHFDVKWSNVIVEKPREAVASWKPSSEASAKDLRVSREELKSAIGQSFGGYYSEADWSKPGSKSKSRSKVGGRGKKNIFIIDVRPPSEFLGQTGDSKWRRVPNIGAVNVSWKEFIDHEGRSNINARKILKTLGIRQDSRIILLSDKGVRSGLVTMALRELGYFNSGNYEGGYQELLSHYRR